MSLRSSDSFTAPPPPEDYRSAPRRNFFTAANRFLAALFVQRKPLDPGGMMAYAGADPHESKIYYEFSHLYDRIFTRFFYPRIVSTIRSLKIPAGAKVLEVGVGTGLALPAYPQHADVTGIDLAPEMLEQAQRKVNTEGWRHIHL